MKIEVLLSACKIKKIKDLNLKQKNIKKAIIINQFMPEYSIEKTKNVTMYSYNEKGIAKSRNRLLENMTGDIGIITDDDITFVKDYEEIIEKSYKENDADIIIFNLKKGKEIIGHKSKFIYNVISIMTVCSCQITFNKNKIIEKNIKFDERFGIGGNFISGEENIFLKECLDKDLKIIHVPIIINEHPEENTTGEDWNDKVIMSKGAFCYRAYKSIYWLLMIYFVVFKFKMYKKNYSVLEFIKLFNKGKKEFINISKKKD